MMKMATGDGSPSGRVPEQGPDWFLVATEALRRRNSRSRLSSGGLGIYRRDWHREQVRGTHWVSTRQGARPRGWVCPPPSWAPRASSPVTLDSSIFQIFQKKSPVIFSAFRELLFLHKNNTTVVLLKTTSLWVITTRAKVFGKVDTTETYQLPQA